jgi:hypothetical protein
MRLLGASRREIRRDKWKKGGKSGGDRGQNPQKPPKIGVSSDIRAFCCRFRVFWWQNEPVWWQKTGFWSGVSDLEGQNRGVSNERCPALFVKLYMDDTPRCGGILLQRVVVGPLSPVWERVRERGYPYLSPSPVSSPIKGEEKPGPARIQTLGASHIGSTYPICQHKLASIPVRQSCHSEARGRRISARKQRLLRRFQLLAMTLLPILPRQPLRTGSASAKSKGGLRCAHRSVQHLLVLESGNLWLGIPQQVLHDLVGVLS